MSEYQRYYQVIRRIPRGRVATYGQIADLAGRPGHARRVGYALAALPMGQKVPWHRVINAKGAVSPRAHPAGDREQIVLLKREHVRFDEQGRICLRRFQWRPPLGL